MWIYAGGAVRVSARLRMVRHHLASRRHGEDDLAAAVAPYVKPGAAIVGTGAGSITGWMNNLQKKLEGLA